MDLPAYKWYWMISTYLLSDSGLYLTSGAPIKGIKVTAKVTSADGVYKGLQTLVLPSIFRMGAIYFDGSKMGLVRIAFW